MFCLLVCMDRLGTSLFSLLFFLFFIFKFPQLLWGHTGSDDKLIALSR